MGKKRIITQTGTDAEILKQQSYISKKKVDAGIFAVEATYNNTKAVFTDTKGNTLAWSTSGSLGFKGAKKGTPFAAAKVGETVALKAQAMGAKDVAIVVRGVGAGRESAIRSFAAKGFNVVSVKDMTPVPHNGPKPKKPRRV